MNALSVTDPAPCEADDSCYGPTTPTGTPSPRPSETTTTTVTNPPSSFGETGGVFSPDVLLGGVLLVAVGIAMFRQRARDRRVGR